MYISDRNQFKNTYFMNPAVIKAIKSFETLHNIYVLLLSKEKHILVLIYVCKYLMLSSLSVSSTTPDFMS